MFFFMWISSSISVHLCAAFTRKTISLRLLQQQQQRQRRLFSQQQNSIFSSIFGLNGSSHSITEWHRHRHSLTVYSLSQKSENHSNSIDKSANDSKDTSQKSEHIALVPNCDVDLINLAAKKSNPKNSLDCTDMSHKSWVDKFPDSVQQYLLLARMDRPIGTWLCVLPALWSLSLNLPAFSPSDSNNWLNSLDSTQLGIFATFLLGGFVVRGAGCTINDILDRDFDAKVERTRRRPLASGQLSVSQGVGFLITQLSIGFGLLMTLNQPTIALGCVCVPLVMVYPLMKRITDYPQAWLGMCFNWGVFMGATAVCGWEINTAATFTLFGSAWCWTMVYDTIYAHMDKHDDAKIGVRSSARAFGDDKKTLSMLAGTQVGLLFMTGYLMNTGIDSITDSCVSRK